MQPKVVWRPSERIPAAPLVTWGEKGSAKGRPTAPSTSSGALEMKRRKMRGEHQKQDSCGLILIWLSVQLFSLANANGMILGI